MAQENNCPQCGTKMPSDAPEGLCPKCLMKAVKQENTEVTLDCSGLIEGPGTKIGRYGLLSLIGEGGMGLVYLAEQKEPVKRRVALKIIKPGMDSAQVIARFEAERQALALLDHPNIAHVFDAGTTETGRPYFVMEYVKGMSITRYCDQRKLDVEQRLRLFREVCEGVHHAHQKGIIHRDLKPSNILVSLHGDRAVPKIIDFGIAKAAASSLTEKTMFTFQGQLLGTPEYMSPEQVDFATQDIDTRSDIYSLGVVLYELLAGVLPFERESLEKIGFSELQRTLREQEPASPSVRLSNLGEKAKAIADSRMTQVVPLARRLHRELEWIPLKAMRKDRCRRYKSASDMADDIQSYLNGNPLLAGPETAIYRMQKFVRKHAGSVATVVLVVAAIILGLIVSTAMYFRAEQARKNELIARTKAELAKEQETAARTRAEQAERATSEKAEELRRTLYVNSIQLADASYRNGDIHRVRELLDSCPEDLRGWEWNHLNYIVDQSLMTLLGHKGKVSCLAFSPDSKNIISSSYDKSIKIWDSKTGTLLKTLTGHEDRITCLAVTPDGKHVASGSVDSTVRIWDVTNGKELIVIQGHKDRIGSISFSPDGKRLASGSRDRTIRVWDITTGDELVAIYSDEKFLGGMCICFSPDGKSIVSASKKIKVWDAVEGKLQMTLSGHKKYKDMEMIEAVVFSPDGRRIISAGFDKTIKVWDVTNGNEIMTLRGHKDIVFCIALSNDGKFIASGSRDNTIKIWDASDGEEIRTIGTGTFVTSLVFDPKSMLITSGGWDGVIKVWDARCKQDVVRLHEPSSSIAFSPDSKRIVSTGTDYSNIFNIWDITTVSQLATLKARTDWSWISPVAFSPNGKWIVSSSLDERIEIRNPETGQILNTYGGHKDIISSIAFSQDSKYFATGSYDGTAKIWDVVNTKELMTLSGQQDRITSVAFSFDGNQIATGGSDGTVKIWKVSDGTELITFDGRQNGITSVAFSPDGKKITTGGSDGTVKIWNVITGVELNTLRGHHLDIGFACVVFSPDGKRIVSGSWDGTVKIWDSITGAELITLAADTTVTSVSFSSDGNSIAAAAKQNGIFVWESAMQADTYKTRKAGIVARELVDELYEENKLYARVIDKLKADETIDKSVRKIALQIANSRLWEDEEKTE